MVNIKLIRLLGFEIWLGKHPRFVIFGKVNQKCVLFSRMYEFNFATKYHILNKFEAEFSSILNPFWTLNNTRLAILRCCRTMDHYFVTYHSNSFFKSIKLEVI